ncbi:MAG: MalY/PatB family protein [Phocaeicola sp.]|uniref:MalY/PatB family protein n=1 Tax=Phocaeicola TaxID=909656 RepID=UPI00234E9445|nr:MalY/PatB family protein [Phocaeicola oris]MCE2617096.1 pyridoxal phosphate-dependent aminotransferase [Phocaeicola oris]
MKYDFDSIINREGTDAIKLTAMMENWGRTDLIPMWVADMDFAAGPFVLDAIRRRCDRGILGYTCKGDHYYNAIIHWINDRYGMSAVKENITFVGGIVPGIALAIDCFSKSGDKVLIQPPVYHPFRNVSTAYGREVVTNPLMLENGQYRMDLDDLRNKAKGCKLMILCNPHNPGGIVWTKEELQAVAEICAKEHVMVFSDEIHADLTLPPCKHTPFCMISEEARQNTVTFMAPSKAFNIAGISASHVIIYNKEWHQQFEAFLERGELNMGHVFATLCVEACYTEGKEWLDQCIRYIQGNIDYVNTFLKEHCPRIKAIEPHASYLIWLDCRELGLTPEQLTDFFVDKAHLALNDGYIFGEEGKGFMRLNIGSPRSIIEKAMKQLAEAYKRQGY